MAGIIEQLADEFKVRKAQVENVVRLIDEGNTIPFIARYRKEMTGELNDQVLREINDRLQYLRNLDERKTAVKRLIDEQGKLSDEIVNALEKAATLQEVEDIYRPFKPKRRTRASIAREKGLEPMALLLYEQKASKTDIEMLALSLINSEKEVNSENDVLTGAMDIIAEWVSDDASHRKLIRNFFYSDGMIISKKKTDEDSVYNMYYDFREPVRKIAAHRILAIFRGEREGFLDVTLDVPDEEIINRIKMKEIKKPGTPCAEYVAMAVEDAYERLMLPSVDNEVRNELKERASEQAIKVFAKNLKSLLLQPPVKGKVVLGLDPAYRTGCKLAVVDETGKVLNTAVIYPTPPQNKTVESAKTVRDLIRRYNIDIISIGNGTASREAEIFIADLIKEMDREIFYMVVSESGASVYSASKLAAEEFPEYDVALRSAVSIARRLQDPLAELVKIDPKAIGVGQYQHDMNQKRLTEALQGVVEDCVNSVGVDLNTASPSLLQYVSGISASLAKSIVEYRESNGKFTDRQQLLNVKKLGPKAFEQCAGFLRITDGSNPLDNTSVHPESYNAVMKLLDMWESSLDEVKTGKLKIRHMNKHMNEHMNESELEAVAVRLNLGVPTLKDILRELEKPGRDPRDELPKPMLLKDVMDISDLKKDMVLKGTVRNVADFGAFVDIGVHQDGLVHISEMSDSFVKDPMDIVSVGDIINVRVINVDVKRNRISLSMKGLNKDPHSIE
jgi:uncharacterized protein